MSQSILRRTHLLKLKGQPTIADPLNLKFLKMRLIHYKNIREHGFIPEYKPRLERKY